MIAGCAGPLSTLDPAGPAAGAVQLLWWIMLAGAAAIFALVLGLLALAFFRRPAAASPRAWAVGGGIVFPMVVLTALLVCGVVLGEKILPRPHENIVRIAAESRQWEWIFRYPDGGKTRNILHIPAGRPVDIDLTTADVIHSFWVPRLAGKLDAIPGRTNRLRIESAAPGIYEGLCAEYCGIGHARHTLRVISHDAAAWRARAESAPS